METKRKEVNSSLGLRIQKGYASNPPQRKSEQHLSGQHPQLTANGPLFWAT